jgi:hypothetical protein
VRVLVYPADDYGCGHHRLIWPSAVLKSQGIDVTVVRVGDRRVEMGFDDDEVLQWMKVPEGVDVVVFQRLTDRRLVQAVSYLRARGIAVVIDVDDDLTSIHPQHPAFHELNPRRAEHEIITARRMGMVRSSAQAAFMQKQLEQKYKHSWRHLEEACRNATLVTVSTEGLLRRYAAHGRGRVFHNYVPEHYLDVQHTDSDVVGWPATLYSHPNDPGPVGNAVARLVGEGMTFVSIGNPTGMGQAFGLPRDPEGTDVDLAEWPRALSQLGIGIAPLADTQFNTCKSWLKPLEMSAVGVPWVASPRVEYQRLHALGAGILVDKPKAWYRTLRKLIDDPSTRAELSARGRDVATRLRLVDNAWVLAEAWSDALATQRKAVAIHH